MNFIKNCLSYLFSHIKANFILQTSYNKRRKKTVTDSPFSDTFLENYCIKTQNPLSSFAIDHCNSIFLFSFIYTMLLLNNFFSFRDIFTINAIWYFKVWIGSNWGITEFVPFLHNEERESYLVLIDENSTREYI